MSFLLRKVEDVTTINKSQSLTSVSIKDCTLRVPNKNATLFLEWAIKKQSSLQQDRVPIKIRSKKWCLRRISFHKICLRCILVTKKSCLRRIVLIIFFLWGISVSCSVYQIISKKTIEFKYSVFRMTKFVKINNIESVKYQILCWS